jgi:hypothetical protein
VAPIRAQIHFLGKPGISIALDRLAGHLSGPVWIKRRRDNVFRYRRRFFQDETVFLNQRKRPETKLRASCLQQTGMAEMQFIFDFIWMQSCENYLEAMGKQETQQ